MKRALKFAGAAVVVGTLASLAVCQESRVYREGSNWVQEITGDLGGARNLRVKLEAGSVRVEGGSQPGVSYVIHRRAYTSSEQKARREFETYKVETYVRGDTAFIEGQSRGGPKRECAGDFVIHVPRTMELAKIETDGGSVIATGIAGRAEIESGGGSIHIDDIGAAVRRRRAGAGLKWATLAAT